MKGLFAIVGIGANRSRHNGQASGIAAFDRPRILRHPI